MGYRKDDCQFDCFYPPYGYDPRTYEVDPNDPQFQMCMDVCDKSFGTQYERMVGVVDWKAVKRSLAEGTFTSFARFTIGDDEYEEEV